MEREVLRSVLGFKILGFKEKEKVINENREDFASGGWWLANYPQTQGVSHRGGLYFNRGSSRGTKTKQEQKDTKSRG